MQQIKLTYTSKYNDFRVWVTVNALNTTDAVRVGDQKLRDQYQNPLDFIVTNSEVLEVEEESELS